MSKSRAEKEREKVIQDRCQIILSGLLKEEDNKYCIDCDSKGPRWASWNIGIFLCIRCAGIHRNLGVHISKVRSVNLDSWTPHQVSCMQNMGNSKGRAVYEANIPDDYRRPTTDSGMEAFIRNKYEKKKFIAKEWVPCKPPDLPSGWDKLIEQEKLNKMKDGKKTNNNEAVSPAPAPKKVEIPAAKPVSVSQPVTSTAASTASAANSDILGLDFGQPATSDTTSSLEDDLLGFSGFVSATPAAATPAAADTKPAAPPTNPETDFFNQVSTPSSTAAVDSSKMSNSSIMALFGNGAPKPFASPLPSTQGVPSPAQQFPGQFQNQFPGQIPGQFNGQQQQQPGVAQQQHQQLLFNNNQSVQNNPFLNLGGTQQMAGQPKVINSIPQNLVQVNNQLSGLKLQGAPADPFSSIFSSNPAPPFQPNSFPAQPNSFPAQPNSFPAPNSALFPGQTFPAQPGYPNSIQNGGLAPSLWQ